MRFVGPWLLVVIGCAPPPAPACSVPLDASYPDGGPPGPPVTRLYVINYLQFPTPTGAAGDEIDGFDLDGTADVVCGQTDWSAPPFLGGGCAVDNALGPFAGGLANASTLQGIDVGRELLLVEVTDINNFVDDASVGVAFYTGRLPSGVVAPRPVGECPTEPSDPTTDPSCRLHPDQTFDVDGPPIASVTGTVVHGRLQASGFDLLLTVELAGPTSALIRDARLDFGISDGALTEGVLGGRITTASLLAMFATHPGVCSATGILADALAMQSDLTPMAIGPCTYADGGLGPGAHDCPAPSRCDPATALCVTCSELSVGIDMDGVSAVRGAMITTPPMDAGMPCLDGGPG